jgi:hypothetical protein
VTLQPTDLVTLDLLQLGLFKTVRRSAREKYPEVPKTAADPRFRSAFASQEGLPKATVVVEASTTLTECTQHSQ